MSNRIPTRIEELEHAMEIDYAERDALRTRLADMTKQRDELLAACKEALDGGELRAHQMIVAAINKATKGDK